MSTSSGGSRGIPAQIGWTSFFCLATLLLFARPALASGAASALPVVTDKPIVPMVLLGLVMLATFAMIAFELMNKVIAALTGAMLAVTMGMGFGIYKAHGGYKEVHHFIEHDLGVLGVIVGTSILVEIASHSGLFHFIAVKLVKATQGRPDKLLPAIMSATIFFVTFLTISPATLIMASLVLVITKALDDDPRPYIVAVAIAANSGALMTFASGICTLMIGTAAKLPYAHFFVASTPVALLSAFLAYRVIRWRYASTLSGGASLEERAAKVACFDEWALVKDKRIFRNCAVILGLTVIGFASAQKLGVGLDFIAMSGGTAALLFSGFDADEAIKRVKWPVILFFVGLFVLIGTVQDTGLLEAIAGRIFDISGTNVTIAVLVLAPMCFILSGVVDNIPVAATMIPVVKSMVAKGLAPEPLWWTVVASCNLGGNPTPVGSVSQVIALHALEKERGIKIGWGEFMRVGLVVTGLQLVLVVTFILGMHSLGAFPKLP